MSYKTRYIDEITSELELKLPTENKEVLRKKAVTIFNKMHSYSKSDGYAQKNTIFASSVQNAVELFLLKENMSALPKNRKTTDINKVTLDAVFVEAKKISVENIASASENSQEIKALLADRDDLILLELILVVEGVNANKDQFTADELAKSYKTLIGMPLTEEHGLKDIQGVYYDSELVDITVYDSDKGQHEMRKAIKALAVFYKDRFLDEAELLILRAEKGTLKFSMECMFESAQCSECNEVYDSPIDYCEHLWHRYDEASATGRILLGVTFVGGAYVKHPAEDNAVLLDLKDFSEEEVMAAAASRGPLYSYASDNKQVVWDHSNISCSRCSSSSKGGDSSMKDFDLIKNTEEFKEYFKAELEKAVAAKVDEMEKNSETEAIKEENTSLKDQLETATEKIGELESDIAERDAMARALDHISSLKEAGLTLSSEQEEKFVKLFKAASDDDVEAIKELALLQVTAGDPEKEDAGDEQDSDDDSEADDEKDAKADEEETDEEETDDDTTDDENDSEASEDETDEDDESESRVEASKKRKRAPKGGKDEDEIVLAHIKDPNTRELVRVMRATHKNARPELYNKN